MSDPVLAAIRQRAKGAIGELRFLTSCRCDAAWTDRQLHDPDCNIDYAVDVDDVEKAFNEALARVGQLEARIQELETLDASKDRVIQRLISEHNEELRIAKGEPERDPRRPRADLYEEHGQFDTDGWDSDPIPAVSDGD